MDFNLKSPVLAALDVDTDTEAFELAKGIGEYVGGFKIGPRLAVRYGQSFIKELAEIAPLFVDNKYLDIPNTVVNSVKATFDCGASFCTVHAWNGPEALRELAKLETGLNQERPFKILVVTVLTSFSKHTLPVGMEKKEMADHVLALAQMAYDCGMRNFVCSPLEAKLLKTRFSDSFLVTPGIRFEPGSADQKRTATPKKALDDGANALVIGRPIYKSPDPKAAAKEIFDHINGVQ